MYWYFDLNVILYLSKNLDDIDAIINSIIDDAKYLISYRMWSLGKSNLYPHFRDDNKDHRFQLLVKYTQDGSRVLISIPFSRYRYYLYFNAHLNPEIAYRLASVCFTSTQYQNITDAIFPMVITEMITIELDQFFFVTTHINMVNDNLQSKIKVIVK